MLKVLLLAARKVKAKNTNVRLVYSKIIVNAPVWREKCDLIGINRLNQTADLEVKWVETSFAGRKSNNSLQIEQTMAYKNRLERTVFRALFLTWH